MLTPCAENVCCSFLSPNILIPWRLLLLWLMKPASLVQLHTINPTSFIIPHYISAQQYTINTLSFRGSAVSSPESPAHVTYFWVSTCLPFLHSLATPSQVHILRAMWRLGSSQHYVIISWLGKGGRGSGCAFACFLLQRLLNSEPCAMLFRVPRWNFGNFGCCAKCCVWIVRVLFIVLGQEMPIQQGEI